VIVEHGTSGSGAAAPLARDIMVEAFQRLPITPAPRDPRVAELSR
jgi:penicillin-binding protein 2